MVMDKKAKLLLVAMVGMGVAIVSCNAAAAPTGSQSTAAMAAFLALNMTDAQFAALKTQIPAAVKDATNKAKSSGATAAQTATAVNAAVKTTVENIFTAQQVALIKKYKKQMSQFLAKATKADLGPLNAFRKVITKAVNQI